VNPKPLLRVSSILSLVAGFGHTFLFLTYKPSHGPQEIAVVDAMKSASFHFGWPASHSYWELYFGYGLFVAISCFVEAGVLWQLANLAGRDSSSVKGMAAIFFLGEAGYAVLMFKFFFLIPIVVHTALAILLATAFATSVPKLEARRPNVRLA